MTAARGEPDGVIIATAGASWRTWWLPGDDNNTNNNNNNATLELLELKGFETQPLAPPLLVIDFFPAGRIGEPGSPSENFFVHSIRLEAISLLKDF